MYVDIDEHGDDVYGKTFIFKLKATFISIYEEVQTFKIVFDDKPEEEPIEEEIATDDEPID